MTTCSMPDCSRPATVRIRMIPRRVDDPICHEIIRALAWPGMAMAADVYVCGHADHLRAVKDAATTTMGCKALGDAEPAVRRVGEGGA